ERGLLQTGIDVVGEQRDDVDLFAVGERRVELDVGCRDAWDRRYRCRDRRQMMTRELALHRADELVEAIDAGIAGGRAVLVLAEDRDDLERAVLPDLVVLGELASGGCSGR